ncbi:uncharacterized protein LOC135079949 [Ostrinia nubilalis]|uniref:uncharacterized protein LOC135079949 n=1 Tax=Ostrinia nubilalis TaxID=29057 RepID=UPI0030822691
MVVVQNDANGPEDGGGARFRPEPSSYLMTFMDIVNMITHMTLGAVAFITIFLGIMYVPVLRQHIILTVVGYVILMTQSILVLSSHNGWSRTIRYKDRKIVHLLMQVFGSILAIAGNIVVMVEKNVHFNTTHGILGLVAMIFTIISLVGGAFHLYIHCMPRVTCLLHCIIGALTMIIGFLALIFGIEETFRTVFGNASTNLLICLTVMSLVGTLLPCCLKLQRGCKF